MISTSVKWASFKNHKTMSKELEEAITGADALVLMVKHKDYLNLNIERIKKKMRRPVIVDGRNAYDKVACEQLGFTYKGVGKPREK